MKKRIKYPGLLENGLGVFSEEITRFALLNPEDEIRLSKIVMGSEGDKQEAIDALVTHNLRLVVSIAHKFKHRGVEMLDLVQAGTLGLIKAAHRYNSKRGNKFGTFATWWIRQSILFEIYSRSSTIRMPPVMRCAIMHIISLKKQLNREPTIEEIESYIPQTYKKMIESALKVIKHGSFNLTQKRETRPGNAIPSEWESIKDARMPNPLTFAMAKDELESIYKKLNEILLGIKNLPMQDSETHRSMFKARYGFENSFNFLLYKQIAKMFAVSRCKVKKVIDNVWEFLTRKGMPGESWLIAEIQRLKLLQNETGEDNFKLSG